MLSTAEEKALAEISGDRARRHVKLLQTPLDRTCGSEAEYQSALKAKTLLDPFVDTCEIEGFPAVTNIRGRGRLEVMKPLPLSIACEVNGISGSGKGRGRLVDAGNGTRYDYNRLGDLKGEIVLISAARNRIGVWWQFLAREAALRGASCLVYNPGGWDDDVMCVHGINVDFPVLTITSRSAADLRKLLREHDEVIVQFESECGRWPATGHSVVGTIQGSLYPKEIIYLSGHHDGYFYGANDNLSSCACVIEAAALLAQHRPKRTFRFILFGGEESGKAFAENIVSGLHGSFHYSEVHRSELLGEDGWMSVCAINGEGLGHSPRARITCSPELIPLIKEVATEIGDHVEVVGAPDGTWTDSDHLCLHTLGVPTVYLHEAVADRGTGLRTRSSRVYHTVEDNIGIISPRALESNARLMALLALRLDAADVPPYSTESTIGEIRRGSDGLPDRMSLIDLIRDKGLLISRIEGREERMRSMLRLLAITNTQTYTYIWRDFLHKFRLLSDTAVKLREAYHIADMEGDLARARAVLVSITRGSVMDGFSAEVLEQMKAVKAAPSVLSRLSTYDFELRDLLVRVDSEVEKDSILAAIDAKRQEVVEIATKWQQEFAEAISSLQETV